MERPNSQIYVLVCRHAVPPSQWLPWQLFTCLLWLPQQVVVGRTFPICLRLVGSLLVASNALIQLCPVSSAAMGRMCIQLSWKYKLLLYIAIGSVYTEECEIGFSFSNCMPVENLSAWHLKVNQYRQLSLKKTLETRLSRASSTIIRGKPGFRLTKYNANACPDN